MEHCASVLRAAKTAVPARILPVLAMPASVAPPASALLALVPALPSPRERARNAVEQNLKLTTLKKKLAFSYIDV